MSKTIISLSGGLDSTCLLLECLAQREEVRAYSFSYGQKHSIELDKVKTNIKFLQEKGLPVTHQVIDLTDVFSDSQSSLHVGGEDIPEGHYQDSGMKSTVVENRNVIFSAIIYGKALSWAKQSGQPIDITLGIHAGDHTIYPDCTPESQQAAEHLFKISNWGSENVNYKAPFVDIPKGEVLRRGLNACRSLGFSDDDINYVLKNTHTCYNPNSAGESCGKCGSCVERLEAFAENDMTDPVPYQ